MRFVSLLVLALTGQVMALEANTTTTSATLSTSATTTSTSTASSNSLAVTVAQDGSGQFTAINAAIVYAQTKSIPTVTIKAGTYTETVVVSATATVTVVGETAATATAASGTEYANNAVIITTNSTSVAALSFGTSSSQGTTWRNINFVNPSTTSLAGAVSLRSSKNAFYGCQFVAAGTVAITSSYASGLIAYSYIEAADKAIYSYPSLYIFASTITVTASSGLLVYTRGATYSTTGTLYNSTTVFDSCSVIQKSGYSNTNVYLGAASSAGSVVLYRNVSLPSFIAAYGAHLDTTTNQAANKYMEYETTGAGSYTYNTASRAALVSYITDPDDLAPYELTQFLANQYPSVAITSTSWIDSGVLAAIQASDADQEASTTAATTYTASSTTTTASTTTSASNSTTATTSATSTSLTAGATLTVAPTPTSGQYGTVASAIAALPNDKKAYVIYILAGTYTEQISITRSGLVTLRGETTFANDFTQNKVLIQFSDGELTSANEDEETPVINSKKTDGTGLALYNINFTNTYPQTSNTAALAADFYGTAFAAYGCAFIGYQDTLLVNQGVQVFSNCYVEGSVDFIWGYSKAYFFQSYIASNTKSAAITAQNRPSASWAGGFVFDSCYITYTSSYGSTYGATYLGRPWSQYAIVVYMNSYLDKHIASAGWEQWSTSSPNTGNVTFGEYNNSGPSSWTSSTARASFATNLTADEAADYSLANFIGDTSSWLDETAYYYTPSYSLGTTLTTTTSGNGTSTATVTATATVSAVWEHPRSGTEPPSGAVTVSKDGSYNGTYSNITDALNSLPDDSTTQIIFVYPGYYVEQLPAINRDGPVMIIGYTTASPGSTYKGNTVTIAYARGLSVSPLPTGHSDAETAVITTTSTTISMYNVDIVNSDNLDGATSSYVTLAASIASTHTGFYGCSFIGWQDTLLTNTKTGYQYYESCYIEGAIDFIWGYSKAYFKGCTVGAKRAKSAITAQSRASSSAIGGYIFDQCLFTAAANATDDLTQLVYLGRPYSEYALVVVKNSYLDSIIQPAGWKVWSTTSPNTDYITFVEYNNSGPGNWESNAAAREAFENCTLLTSDTYPLATVMDSTSWIDLTNWDSIATPQVATTTTTTTNTTDAWVYDGTTPPTGAYVVSKTTIAGVTTYDTIQSALDALPTSSKTTGIVFIYPGIYEEQLILSKSGTTILMGYSNASSDWSANQVTITYASGVDTGADQSNSDSATVYAKGNYLQAVNINFANTFGTTDDYASLGFAVASSKYASLFGCQVYGNQDSLYISGYLFAYNSYFEGNVDMIYGNGAAYFLSSTISPNEDGINLTADKRTTNTTAGGFVFDQCTVTPADGASFEEISLGRPWNSYARVAFIESDLGSCVEAAGWNQWSKTSPNTDGVMFGEYNNYGAGSDTSERASFVTLLTADEAAQFELATFFASTSWINMTMVDVTPFSANASTIATTSATIVTATSTSTSSTLSTTLLTTTLYATNTAYASRTTIAKVTTVTTITAADTTTTIAETTTVNAATTITPDSTTKTTTVKATVTEATTLVEDDVTTTKATTETLSLGSTVSGSTVTKTSTEFDTVTVTTTATAAGDDTTVKATTTVTSTVTGTAAKASTTTYTVETATTSIKTVTPAGSTTTTTVTVTTGAGGTTTTTAKATTVTVTVLTTSTKTAKSTTTLTCTPAAKLKRRGLSGPALAVRWAELYERDYLYLTTTTTSTVYSTVTSDAKTSTVTIAGSTYTTEEVEATKTTGKTTTLKPSTVTETTTSVSTKETTYTLDGTTETDWVTTTKTTGKTTTLKATTTTDVVAATTTKTAGTTTTEPGSTTTSVKTTTVKTTTTPVAADAVTKTVTDVETDKVTTTLAGVIVTKTKTTTSTLAASVTVTNQSTKTKTTTSKVTVTTTTWSTKTSKGAAACTA